MPPTECHSPPLGHPSPPGDAPPPGRAWKRCQMNFRCVRGSVPAIAMRKRRPHPAMARSGHASASAVMIASTISFAQWLVHSVTGAPSFAHTTVPGLGNHPQDAERTVVLRDIGIDQIGERHRDGRLHVGMRGIHEAGALRIGRRQIDRQVRSGLGHARADHDVLAAMPVVVERRMPLVDTVAPGSDHRAGAPLRGVEHRLDRGEQPRRAELLEQCREAPFRQPCRSDHRGEIAAKIATVPNVRGEQRDNVVTTNASVVELQRRDADALLPDLRRAGIVCAVRRASDVALVRAVDRPEEEFTAVEHRHERGHVRQMIAAMIWIVEQKNVAGMDLTAKASDTARAAQGIAPTCTGTCSACAIRRSFRVDQRAGKVTRRVEDLRVCGPQHRLAHLLHDREQAMLHQGGGDRIGMRKSRTSELHQGRFGISLPSKESSDARAIIPGSRRHTRYMDI